MQCCLFIGNIKLDSIAALAPMAGVTDRAFREICETFGACLLTSEMVSVKGLIFDSKKTLKLIDHENLGTPFAVQLFGHSPDDFAAATQIVCNLGIDIIDVNMGCPAPKILKSGAGSHLMKDPKLCGKIVDSIKRNTNLPVTVKIRSGIDSNSKNATEVAKECEFYGADAITIHARTQKQMYSGKADLDIIKDVVNSVKIPIVGNGDITDYKTAKFMMDYTGCKLVAVGRGALGNPWIFKSLALEKDLPLPILEERVKVIDSHIKKIIKYKGAEIGIKESRKHVSWYLKGIKGISSMRKQIFSMNSLDDFKLLLDNLTKIN